MQIPRHPTTTPSAALQGFTLLELMIALAILSLMAALWLGGLHSGARVWSVTSAKSDMLHETEAVQDFLRREMEQVYPEYVNDGHSGGRVAFAGSTDRLTMVAPLPAALGSGFAKLTIRQDAAARDRSLVAEWRSEAGARLAGEEGSSVEHVLLRDVEGVEFGYFGALSPTERPEWHADWHDRLVLPRLIRVRVKFAGADPRNWPELVARPMVSVDTGCVYDPVSRSCRGR
jgi:general secretion pathway protein J